MEDKRTLHILWTNSDLETSRYMVMMYARNSMLRQWWGGVTVIIWGATARLVAENEIIQDEMKTAAQAGVKFTACIACARQLGVTEKLEALGVEVISWGPPLTDILRDHGHLLTV
jgi:hypothetical protein